MWVRVNSREADVPVFARDALAVFQGAVLNKPHALQTVCEGSVILFVVPQGGPHPLHVTEQYLEERASWRMLAVCNKCEMSELFDAPSAIVKHSFPTLSPDQLSGFTFTTSCGWCGGGQAVRLIRKKC